MLGNQVTEAHLDLGMAVRAEQDALRRLVTLGRDAQRRAAPEREALRRGIDMMEVQRSQAAVIAAESAATTGLVDEQPLCALAPTRHRLGGAAGTAPRAVGSEHKERWTVLGTHAPPALHLARGASPSRRTRTQAVAREPVSDGGRASIHDRCDRPHAQVAGDQLLESRSVDRPSCCLRRDPPERPTVLDQPCELLVHNTNTSSPHGRNEALRPSPDRPPRRDGP